MPPPVLPSSTNTPDPDPVTVKVTLPGGVSVTMAQADAELFFAAQTKNNTERDNLAARAGAAEAERKAAEDRANREASEKEAMRLTKEGEFAKAKEILTRESSERLNRVGTRLRDQALEAAALAAAPGLDARARQDIVALNRSRAAFNADTGEVVALAEDGTPLVVDGKPAGLDWILAGFIKDRPHLQVQYVPPQQHGSPGSPPGGLVGVLKLADLPKITPAQGEALKSGKLRLEA